ncbi:MAG TPA: alpha amylase [Clostridiales bacterium]|nr:alpha amylase [Clostridiales bacterium]
MKKFIIVILMLAFVLSSCSPAGDSTKILDNYRNYYEIFVRSYYDSDGDLLGDLAGVTAKLDYIAADLGADGIWLMPVMPSPTYHKYDVTDYYSIDPAYGTLADFDQLIAEAHDREIKVIIDLVLNHTSNLHPWFAAAVDALWAGTGSPYIDYYNFTTEDRGEGYSLITDQYYYECRFVTGMPDLNLDSADLRSEILKIARFWLDRGVDGFRLDAVTSFYTGNSDRNIAFLAWFNDQVKAYRPDAYLIGEAWADGGTIAGYYASGIDSFFNFPYSSATGYLAQVIVDQNGAGFAESVASWNKQIAAQNPAAQDAFFLSNHDQARSAGFLMRSLQKEKLAAALYLLTPGNPFIYYGEELGMNGSGIDENKRLPMYWSAADRTGITGAPPNATQTVEGIAGADVQAKDKSSLLNAYKNILAVKGRHPGIARGTPASLDTGLRGIAGLAFTYLESTVYVLHNLTADSQQVDLDAVSLDKLKIADYLLTETGKPRISGRTITLPPMSTTILR